MTRLIGFQFCFTSLYPGSKILHFSQSSFFSLFSPLNILKFQKAIHLDSSFWHPSDSIASSMADPGQQDWTVPETPRISQARGKVIGIYGLPGCGKTYLLHQLQNALSGESFTFYEGSQVIAGLVPGGLSAFQQMPEELKEEWRTSAIVKIGKECGETGRTGVVTGHFRFWPEGEDMPMPVCTSKDLQVFTHIIYLEVPPETIAQRQQADTSRSRSPASVAHLKKWQESEHNQLQLLCRVHHVLFIRVSADAQLLDRVITLLHDFERHSEEHNRAQALDKLEAVTPGSGEVKTMLVLDADRTMAAEDTGKLFWEKLAASSPLDEDQVWPLKALFDSELAYTYTAFRQAMLLYEGTAGDQAFDSLCRQVASGVTLHPALLSLLQLVAEQEHVGAVVVTCGLRRVWELVLERDGLGETVKVIGGGRLADGFVVTAEVKAAVVTRLQKQARVWAFGDGPLDLDMLQRADHAVVVVGEEDTRSKSMDQPLRDAITNGRLSARQALLPDHASPRLDTTMLPLIDLTSRHFVDAVIGRPTHRRSVHRPHPEQHPAAKLLATPMRDARVAGPALRAAHRRAGWYLAVEHAARRLGLEAHAVPHVQGHAAAGYRAFGEGQTTVVALMRGGEPLAAGVADALPRAALVHAGRPADLRGPHVRGRVNVLLVDAVVDSGATLLGFVRRVRDLHASVRIVVVAGVVQRQAVEGDGACARELARCPNLSVVALRLSDNKFTGSGTTDTGNRLFNTTHLH